MSANEKNNEQEAAAVKEVIAAEVVEAPKPEAKPVERTYNQEQMKEIVQAAVELAVGDFTKKQEAAAAEAKPADPEGGEQTEKSLLQRTLEVGGGILVAGLLVLGGVAVYQYAKGADAKAEGSEGNANNIIPMTAAA